MSNATTLGIVKLALRVTTDAFNNEINNLIDAAMEDLRIAGVTDHQAVITDKLTLVAITTYVKMHFGEPDQYDRLKKSYDEQKAQLATASGYTKWNSEACNGPLDTY